MLATKHLIDVGSKRVAHIRGPANCLGIRSLEGYKRILAQEGLKSSDDCIVSRQTVDKQSRQRGNETMRQLLNLKPRPDGVFCYNDPLAMGSGSQKTWLLSVAAICITIPPCATRFPASTSTAGSSERKPRD